jgi:MoaA/NifB/PqqE/SkfB family radical SAM enzyme
VKALKIIQRSNGHANEMRSWIVAAELYVTTKCNVGCSFCFGQGDFGIRGHHVPIDILLRRAEILLAYHRQDPFYSVPLLGGEPLLHPQLQLLAEAYGKHLPFALVTAGEPENSADLEVLIENIHRWGVTYNSHLTDRYLKLTKKLLEARRQVVTTIHFWNHESFVAMNKHFVENALPHLACISDGWKDDFMKYLEMWRQTNYYDVSFNPFYHDNSDDDVPMIMRYTAYDERFTRATPKSFDPPLLPQGRKFDCHLFVPKKAISIDEDGQVIPCASIAHRHTHPIIKNLERFGYLPENLPQYMDRCAKMFLSVGPNRKCDVRCKLIEWNMDQ